MMFFFDDSGSGGGVDPYFSNVVLLLNMQGANGSTTFTDSSPLAQTLTAVGDAKISTDQSVVPGGTSGKFDGSGDRVTFGSGNGVAMGTGDFTIEIWARFNVIDAGTQTLIDYRPSANGAYPSIGVINGKLSYVANSAIAIQASSDLSANVWYHFELTRASSYDWLYSNGVYVGTIGPDTTNYLVPSGTGRPFIGSDAFASTQTVNGYIGAVRITKGVARHSGTSPFTPPVPPFPTN